MCGKKNSLFPFAVFATLGAGLVYLFKNYDIKITRKMVAEDITEEQVSFVPEYLDIDSTYQASFSEEISETESFCEPEPATEEISSISLDEEPAEIKEDTAQEAETEGSEVYYQKL